MKNPTAKRIAKLINHRNNLPNKLGEYQIYDGNYFYISINEGFDNEEILACARAKMMSFFCYELKHVAVNEKYEGQGLGKLMISLVETFVSQKQIPILLATTRTENHRINNLFSRLGYSKTKEFTNQGTKHPLILWKKELL
jgi:ribosomal protein S18 acetylase RimI-like enzyme